MSSPRPLIPQLAVLGYPPAAITYLAFSHYHFDHVANANAFTGSTWLVHQAESDAMFAVKPQEQSAYNRLKTSKTVILTDADYDVFGDGTVIIKVCSRPHPRPPSAGVEAAENRPCSHCRRPLALPGRANNLRRSQV
ncbi:MBL fold metallo-hydrolase [Tunturiibacter psychrotolerans]|uniref:MBL fold metallo-hydrolase n=1 Tax=Tunturiibacter psychrotolerans TaxID=3069686 RepID=UPI003D222B32